jgi:imidazolonepropionase-like amidohydrolase
MDPHIRRLTCALIATSLAASAQNVQREGGLGGALPRPVRQVPAPTGTLYIRCGTLLNGKSDQPRANVVITVEGERIKQIGADSPPTGTPIVDLSSQTCLPGMIDTHTHVFLQGDRKPGQYDAQLLKQSVAYRAIEATAAARQMLDYGFTAIRDLETEGAGYADADVRDAISAGIVPGPRMQVATRAMDVTGAYPLAPAYAWDVSVPVGVQTVDGADGGRKAVREQISHGADWIKVYADRGGQLQPNGVIEDIPTFTLDEMRAIADETHRQRHKLAVHATGLHGVHNAVEAGADTIEHGNYIAPDDLKTMAQRGIYLVPTLYVAQYDAELRAGPGGTPQETRGIRGHADTFRRALQAGVKIAFGTDAGAFEWDVNPAREFPLMVKAGMTPAQALRSATSVAADLMGLQSDIGSIEPGKFADIVAVPGNPLDDITLLQKVSFVMKGGTVYKK